MLALSMPINKFVTVIPLPKYAYFCNIIAISVDVIMLRKGDLHETPDWNGTGTGSGVWNRN